MKGTKVISNLSFTFIFSLVTCLLGTTQVQAQHDRTWVSNNGDDNNPCTRLQPCKTFAGAITKTNAGGEIVAVNSGGYGPVTITKSITIDGGGVYAGINSTQDGFAILIQAHADDVVVLRGLTLNGGQTVDHFNNYGIYVVKAGSLFVENCTISAFGRGLSAAGKTAQLFIKDSIFRANGAGVDPGLGGGTLEHCRIEKNNFGLHIEDGSHPVTISNSLVSENTYGIEVIAPGNNTALTIEQCVITGSQFGIIAEGDFARIFVSETMLSNNNVALNSTGGSRIVSFGNNRLAHNSTDGAFTSTKPQQ